MPPRNDEAVPVIDPSKGLPEPRVAVDPAGAVPGETRVGFAGDLLSGRFDFGAVHPFPARSSDARGGGISEAAASGDWLHLSKSCLELSKRCLATARVAAAKSGADGVVIGQRAVFAEKLARLAAETFAMEAMTLCAVGLAERGRATGLQIEAAMTKVWASERSREHEWAVRQIRQAGGQAPEPATSTVWPGSNDELRLAVARAVVAEHWKRIAPVLNVQRTGKERFETGRRAAWHYARWYPRQWLGPLADLGLLFSDLSPRLAAHVRWSARASHRLSRALFHALVLHGAKLEHEELLLGRLADLATELWAISAVCSYAQHLHTPGSLELADYFARATRLKIEGQFRTLHQHTDRAGERLAQSVLDGRHAWMDGGKRD